MAGAVLIVDDDEAIRASLAWVLQDEGYTVLTAPDGTPALEHICTVPEPMVILLDLAMPLMDGYAVLDALERADPLVARHVYVILTSRYGHLPLEQRDRFIRLGIPVFGKPFELDQILATVARADQHLHAIQPPSREQ